MNEHVYKRKVVGWTFGYERKLTECNLSVRGKWLNKHLIVRGK